MLMMIIIIFRYYGKKLESAESHRMSKMSSHYFQLRYFMSWHRFPSKRQQQNEKCEIHLPLLGFAFVV